MGFGFHATTKIKSGMPTAKVRRYRFFTQVTQMTWNLVLQKQGSNIVIWALRITIRNIWKSTDDRISMENKMRIRCEPDKGDFVILESNSAKTQLRLQGSWPVRRRFDQLAWWLVDRWGTLSIWVHIAYRRPSVHKVRSAERVVLPHRWYIEALPASPSYCSVVD